MPSGYVGAEHKFGRSSIIRVNSKHYVRWQRRKNVKEQMKDIHPITKQQYEQMKTLLGPVVTKQVRDVQDGYQAVVYLHETSTTHYMRVKRYLKKHQII